MIPQNMCNMSSRDKPAIVLFTPKDRKIDSQSPVVVSVVWAALLMSVTVFIILQFWVSFV